MALIYLSLGSNIERHRHITAALDALADLFGELKISRVFESKSVGFEGSNFFNLVVGANTQLSVADLSETLKQIEDANGRKRSGPKFSPRSLDIDILTYDNLVGLEAGVELPRAEILSNAFVLKPLAELAPLQRHPQLQHTYAALWQAYDQASQALWAIDFEWCGKLISRADSSQR
jgi:2-amino-4-hydroxy-6-hydroxymethyldihydropteridine diphosphokinase